MIVYHFFLHCWGVVAWRVRTSANVLDMYNVSFNHVSCVFDFKVRMLKFQFQTVCNNLNICSEFFALSIALSIAPLHGDIFIHSVASTEHTKISLYTRATLRTDRQHTPIPTTTVLEAKTDG